MNAEEREKKLLNLMRVERGEAFWAARREAISAAARADRPAGRAWLLVPAAAAAALLLVAMPERGGPPQVPPMEASVSGAFLENLDLLADMDVLESLPEEVL